MPDPRFGRPKAEPSLSRRDQQRAIEEGIDVIRDAIRQLLAKPKSERDAHLRRLAADLEAMNARVGAIDAGSDGARRLKATKNIIEILERVSTEL